MSVRNPKANAVQGVVVAAKELRAAVEQGRTGLFLAVLEWILVGHSVEVDYKALTKATYRAMKLDHTMPAYFVIANAFKQIKRVVSSENRYLQAELNLIADGESMRYSFEALLDWATSGRKPGKGKKPSKQTPVQRVKAALEALTVVQLKAVIAAARKEIRSR